VIGFSVHALFLILYFALYNLREKLVDAESLMGILTISFPLFFSSRRKYPECRLCGAYGSSMLADVLPATALQLHLSSTQSRNIDLSPRDF
jgi:hypothetical protein